jgi:RNA polymerase sigma-70 factor (ECF subfamily)
MDSFEDLMARLRAGDNRAATEVFQRFAGRLIALARSRLDTVIRQKVEPEEIVNSVFKSFLLRQAQGQFELGNWDNLWTLLTLLTVRKCATQAKHFLRGRRNVQREAAAQPLANDSSVAWDFIDREPTPDDAAVLTDTLAQAMAELDERDRGILALHLQSKSVTEISAEIGYAPRTVRRALEHIQKGLERLLKEEV